MAIDEILRDVRIRIEKADPFQPLFYMDVREVHDIVDWFINSDTFHCTSFEPNEMRAAFQALPIEVVTEDGTGLISVATLMKVLDRFECHKMTGGCNTWTDWMKTWIREHRVALDKEREVMPQHLHIKTEL
jgi:hypothetical protein